MMQNNFAEINNNLSQLETLDPDRVEENVAPPIAWASDEMAYEMDLESLTRKEARRMLIDAMNKIAQTKNAKRLEMYREDVAAWREFVLQEENDGKNKPFPQPPLLLKTFNRKSIDQAVFRARQYGCFKILLQKAGFRP